MNQSRMMVKPLIVGSLLLALLTTAWIYRRPPGTPRSLDINFSDGKDARVIVRSGMVLCPAGEFQMGHGTSASDHVVHPVSIPAFWIDQHEVTNQQFERFVEVTGYVTQAEQAGQASVMDLSRGEWRKVEGANWRQPQGPQSTIVGRDNHPVVQVSWHDAQAYASWAKKRLPTEAEWEYAARAGIYGRDFPWKGDAYTPARANYWQGAMPNLLRPLDGFRGTAPVGSFPSNRFHVSDMTGNVWEWCADWYSYRYYQRAITANPQGPRSGKHRVLRGGSWLSSLDQVTVWHRHALAPHFCNDQIGFRCARDARQ